jgi:hypothetical protein
MQIRASLISDSIQGAFASDAEPIKKRTLPEDVVEAIISFFAIFKLLLARYRPVDFLTLRHDTWRLNEQEYIASFQPSALPSGSTGKGRENELIPAGDLGYSGSTFFTTPNGKYLIKSLPRRFEHEFFTHDLFAAYVSHMSSHPHSLLVRITDMVYTPHATIGGILGTAPTHHIIMENLLYGKESAGEQGKKKWETYDLKPNDFFFPERDIMDGKLAPESVKDKLIDEFPDKVRVSSEQKKELLLLLEADTKVLEQNNAIDYSLFLVRYPGPNSAERGDDVPCVKSDSNSWRSGIDDSDGEWTYRMVVLDFFWAKHKFHAMAMTGLVNSFNLLANKGPMSITANPDEYRHRFLKMVDTIVAAE